MCARWAIATIEGPFARPLVRASDEERERTVKRLRAHAAAGRLSVDELAERTEAALAARSRAELHRLTADLPRLRSVRIARAGLRAHALAYAGVAAASLAGWALAGAEDPERLAWLLGWGGGVAWHWSAVRARVARARRRGLLAP